MFPFSSDQHIRPPAVAGKFYPSDPDELRGLVNTLLAQASFVPGPVPKAIIVPHAGYPFSGPIAATAYARLKPARDTIRRVVLLGPSHAIAVPGLAAVTSTAFATPLGTVPVDCEMIQKLCSLPQVTLLDEAHRREHAIEVQLPFLQVVLSDFRIIPLLAGEADAEQISQVLEMLWGGPETCLVISSDLSHYHNSQTARELDRATAQAIEALEPNRIDADQACGRIPVRGLLCAVRAHKLTAHTLDLRNSGDTGGPRERVVGYGAFAFEEHS